MKYFYEYVDSKEKNYISEKKVFITDLKEINRELQITYANGTKDYVPNVPSARKKYTNIMKEQAKIGRHLLPKLQKKIIIRYCTSMISIGLTLVLFTRLTFIHSNFISGQIMDLIGSLVFAFVSILAVSDAISIKDVIDDIKKNEIYLNIEEEINEENLEKEKILKYVSDFTKEKIKSMPDDISIEKLDKIPLEDIVQINKNIDEEMYEKSKTLVLKPNNNRRVHR